MTILPILAVTAASMPQTILLRPNAEFPELGQETVVHYNDIQASAPFDEVIPSWNVKQAENAAVRIEIRGRGPRGLTKWYRVADWSLDANRHPRESMEGQKDENGDVLTDTVRFAQPLQSIDIAVRLKTLADGPKGKLDLLALSFSRGKGVPNDKKESSPAWGKLIDVPQRAQGNYPNGGVLCSPTCTSMMLWHYSNIFNRPEMNKDVPEVVDGVWDKVYDGAGNWPFNTAYMGSFEGITSYVRRYESISDLEPWIEAGLPIVTSVSLNLLRGEPKDGNTGHLVILLGFTKDGDPIFNDPAKRDEVRRTYKREHFETAWLNSNRTVYVVLPDGKKAPN